MGYLDFTRPEMLLLLVLLYPVYLWHKKSLSDMPRWRKITVLIIRILIVILLILSLAGFRFRLPKNNMSILFVVDTSLSISPENQEWAKEYIQEEVRQLPRDDTAGVIVFGKDAYLEESLSHTPKIRRFSSIVSPEHTNLSKAIQLATAVFPEWGIKRIILISDGNQTLGDAEHQSALAFSRGVEVRCLPYPQENFPEVLVDQVETPEKISQSEPFYLKIKLDSNTKTQGILKIFRNNEPIAREKVEIFEGSNQFLITQNIDEPGNYIYKVAVETEGDKFANNNTAESMAIIQGYPRILYICSDPVQKNYIPPVISGHNIKVEAGTIKDLPQNLAEISGYSSVVLDNVSGLSLSPSQMIMIENYVKDLGGGLVMIGGDNSFGAGGYYKTPIEKILPVDLDIKKKKNLPSVAMVLCIDKSGSMSEMTNNVEKISLAREAAIATVDLLRPQDLIGIIGFDSASKWVCPLQRASDKKKIIQDIATIRAGGGTSMYPAMREALDSLKNAKAMVKHVIVLTDGRTEPGDFDALLMEMKQNKITVSAIGVGMDTDIPFLEDVAKKGDGRFYFTEDASLLPRIFVREAILAGRSAIVEEPFYPKLTEDMEYLRGLNIKTVPQLYGYVMTAPKPRANIAMITHQDDPLLASWRVGLGKSIAFTSDCGLKWGKDWAGWDTFEPFWSQVIRWTVNQPGDDRYQVFFNQSHGKGSIMVEAGDEEGNPINFLGLKARVVSPSGKTQDLDLFQLAPGRYQQNFDTKETGTYLVNLLEEADGELHPSALKSFTLSYSPEYATFKTNYPLLEKIAGLTGGRIIEKEDDIYDRQGKTVFYPRNVWREILLLLLFLFPLDIALRRVYLPENLFRPKEIRKKAQEPEEGSLSTLKYKKEALKEELTQSRINISSIKQEGKTAPQDSLMFLDTPSKTDKITPPSAPHEKEKIQKEEKPSEESNMLSKLKKFKKEISQKTDRQS